MVGVSFLLVVMTGAGDRYGDEKGVMELADAIIVNSKLIDKNSGQWLPERI